MKPLLERGEAMEKHRVREAKSIDGNGDHLFVEVKKDTWIEVDNLPSHETIEKYNQLQSKNELDLSFNSRAFSIGIIKDWKELKVIDSYTYPNGCEWCGECDYCHTLIDTHKCPHCGFVNSEKYDFCSNYQAILAMPEALPGGGGYGVLGAVPECDGKERINYALEPIPNDTESAAKEEIRNLVDRKSVV